jgi:hypothetical protein
MVPEQNSQQQTPLNEIMLLTNTKTIQPFEVLIGEKTSCLINLVWSNSSVNWALEGQPMATEHAHR